MKKFILFMFACFFSCQLVAQKPCSGPTYRQFDFWIGQWEVYGLNGRKAGDSKISLILDSCIILEEWTSANVTQGVRFAGKSFNTYNRRTNQWQQTWVDNVGGATEYLDGKYENKKMIFQTKPYQFTRDTMAIMRLTFHDLSKDKVRQHGEISKDNGATWTTQYDLEYRRKNE